MFLLLLSYRFPSSAVKWIRVTFQCFSKQVKWSSSFFFNEFQSVNNVEIDLRDLKPETFRQNCYKVKRGFAISTNTWDPTFLMANHHCAPHAREPLDRYCLSRNDSLLHSLLKAPPHDWITCCGRWECVTWNSCSTYLTEGKFMHDESVGNGTASRVNYFFYRKRGPSRSRCTHVQIQ